MSAPVLEVRNLCFAYPDGTEALKGISFALPPRTALALVGANGAGKSTLLMHLNGYLMPTRGEVRLGDLLLTPASASRIRRAVGLVFQDPDDQLFMPTVFDDVAFGPLHAGLPADVVEQRATDALARVNMLHVRARPPHKLSAGEKRAVAIATVLAMQPDVLVLDEPTSNLDPRGRRRLMALLQSLDHSTIIATHDLELVVEVCSHVLVLDGGKVVAEGPAREILNDEPLMLAHGLERPHILRHHHPH